MAPTTASSSVTGTVDGSHEFKIAGYSLIKGMGIGNSVQSETFTVGGYEWAIYFYPDGKSRDDDAAYVSLFVALQGEGTNVRALFELVLLDQSGEGKHKVHSHFHVWPERGPYALKHQGAMWGYKRFFQRALLEGSNYLKDDSLVVRCRVGVVRSLTVQSLKPKSNIEKKPESKNTSLNSDQVSHFETLLDNDQQGSATKAQLNTVATETSDPSNANIDA